MGNKRKYPSIWPILIINALVVMLLGLNYSSWKLNQLIILGVIALIVIIGTAIYMSKGYKVYHKRKYIMASIIGSIIFIAAVSFMLM